MKKERKCICCYARFGNSSQLKMEQRESELRYYADTHNLEIEKIEFEHLSGLEHSTILKQLIEDKDIKTILTPTVSCLTRDIKLLLDIEEQADKHNTKIISVDGSYEMNPIIENPLSEYILNNLSKYLSKAKA